MPDADTPQHLAPSQHPAAKWVFGDSPAFFGFRNPAPDATAPASVSRCRTFAVSSAARSGFGG